ncbi:2-oxo-hept-4-ene-1,7-dioate hydratase [Sphingobium sp. MK2]|uniref:2-oxo-hept-4-ene-1,7-dioate hydratase n=1 Tax=Sphingobium sp. MK2 TaxID=3116540 RepID=UPI0032E3600A
MPLSPQDIAALATELDSAERERRQIRQLSLRFPQMGFNDGYAVQQAWVDHKLAHGRTVIGHKIGLTSRAMQRAANITEPDHGVLLDDMLFHSGDDLPFDRFIVPRVEVELAFVLRRDLAGHDVALEDVLAATEYVVPALEIIDARIERIDTETGTTRTVVDTISDNAANAAIILGDVKTAPDVFDWRWACAVLHVNDGIEETGVAAAVLGHPATGVAWLARKLAVRNVGLQAGQIILGGSFTAPIGLAKGDNIFADYGPLGQIRAKFT